jgi:hypothetical protein
MNAHTPGPWQFYELTNGRNAPDGLGYIRALPEDGMEIAHHGDSGRSTEENRANALLIVAAPEMLAALKLAAVILEGAIHPGCRKPGDGLDQIRAVIAKATGLAA